MRIVLIKDLPGVRQPEASFDDALVRIGRDAGECQVTFEDGRYPMVSRRHAELRRHDGHWYLLDLNSTFGTFLNGQRVSGPQPVQPGSAILLGEDGPTLRVVRFDAGYDGPHHAPSAQTPAGAATMPLDPGGPAATPAGAGTGGTWLDAVAGPALTGHAAAGPALAGPFAVTRDSIWLGRDSSCDVVMRPDAFTVSRRHAQIRRDRDGFVVHDNGSFNGTLVNGQRIATPTPLYDNDELQLGMGGPVIKFRCPGRPAPAGATIAGQRAVAASQAAAVPPASDPAYKTLMSASKAGPPSTTARDRSAEPQLLMSLTFGTKPALYVGRSGQNDIRLDGLQISNQHARLVRTPDGVVVEDLNSTNGVFVDGQRVDRRAITPADAVQIGSFLLRFDPYGNVGVFDTRSKTRIDAVDITKDVPDRTGRGTVRLLDGVSLTIMPNEFVGLLGPSGAGKSTFMDALNGMRPASGGNVLVNDLDLYRNLDAIKQSIGYVPQDDIIHRELTVYRTLHYVAKLRLSGDVSRAEVAQIVDEVMDVTGLTERRDVPISQLSGGQRKRVSVAVELITKPSVIFLDEPTSGLDPATEEKIMRLFRQIAESGRTVILTTHAMENVRLFDKIVLLMRGKLVFYGPPADAMAHVGAKSFKELYDKIEEPIEPTMRANPGMTRHQATELVAEEWKQRFTQTAHYRWNVYEPRKDLGRLQSGPPQRGRQLGLLGSVRQFVHLSRRYREVLWRDKTNLLILLAQAPIIALLTYLVMGPDQPRDFAFFVLSLVAVWFGTSVSAREVVRERAIYNRERMVNLGLLPYVASKLFILGSIVGLQCLCLFAPLKLLDHVGVMPMPGPDYGLPQFGIMLLTAAVGIALGLLISALVKTPEMATSLVPLILIPQILFSGLVGVPTGANRVVGMAMPAAWAFDSMKRLSGLDTLEQEGAKPDGKFGGNGYYYWVEAENDKLIANSRQKLNDFRDAEERKMKDFEARLKEDLRAHPPRQPADVPRPATAPSIDDPKKVADAEVRTLVTFLHPWMGDVRNPVVLGAMFVLLAAATLGTLRKQDIA